MYEAKHVNALQRMLAAYCTRPHELICVTDMPNGIDCKVTPLWDDPTILTETGAPNCYRRLKLFSPDYPWGKLVCIDLDCVMFGNIDSLFTNHEFRIVKGYNARYNGSMWMLKVGTRTRAYDQFTAEGVRLAARKGYLGSDQAWLSYILPDEAVWWPEDGVQLIADLKTKNAPLLPTTKILFCPGMTKPWHPAMKLKFPAIHAQYAKFL